MSPREFLSLRDYLGPELSGRTISDARYTKWLTGIQSCLGASAARGDAIRNEIFRECRASLAPHKVPATIRFVGELDVTPAGKLARADA
jgi:acyl-CoA synthetase (AMP-forming)/AMP-acid ligase II